MKKKIPSPPIELFSKTYYTLTTFKEGEQEPENDFEKNLRILTDIEDVHKIPINKLFSLFDRKIGLKTDFKILAEIFQIYSPETTKEGFLEMLKICEQDQQYRTKIKTYFLNSLKKFVANKNIILAEQKQTSKTKMKYGVTPEFVSVAEGLYLDYLKFLYSENHIHFLKIYRCKCHRIVTMELERCPSCDALLGWEKIDPQGVSLRYVQKNKLPVSTRWKEFSDKLKTEKNYGAWPEGNPELVKCSKCNNGTIIKRDEAGEEYSAHCECRQHNRAVTDFKSKLLEASIPKDFWYLDTKGYINSSGYSYDRIENEINLQIIKKYCNNMESHLENGRSLYLFGDNNSGKTMLMTILLKEAIKKGYRVKFQTMSEIITGYMKNWFEKKDISVFKECDLLGVDDSFDRRKTYTSENQIQISQIDDLFRHRIHHWKSTIITANIAEHDLENNDSILNVNLVRLLSRKMLQLTFRGDHTVNLQDKLRKEIIGG